MICYLLDCMFFHEYIQPNDTWIYFFIDVNKNEMASLDEIAKLKIERIKQFYDFR
jgi:hypothetical protein